MLISLYFTHFDATETTVFNSSGSVTKSAGGFSGTVDNTFAGITTTVTNKENLGVEFSQGLATPEITHEAAFYILIIEQPFIVNLKQKKI